MIDVARPPMDAPRRMAWTLLALAPPVAAEAMVRGSAWVMGWLLASVLATLVASWLVRRPGKASTRGLLAHLDAATATTLVFLLLPAGTSPTLAGAAAIVSVVLARNLFGGLGQNLFNPAMLALAILVVFVPTPDASTAWSALAAAACWLGSGMLLARRVLPWRAPIGFLAGALATAVVLGAPATAWESSIGVLLDPALVLCAFFVAGDSIPGCLQQRARWIYGLAGGALVIALDRRYPGTGLPLAMLLMNFLAPWLDHAAAKSRPGVVLQ